MFPFLSLEHVDLDVEIAQRLARRLAYYHLALPIAEDADGITVAMAHPDNGRVISVLEAALKAKVIPVQSFAETIRQQLDRVWQVQNPAAALRVLLWAQSVEELRQSAGYVDGFIAALGRETTVEPVASETLLPLSGVDLVVVVSPGGALPVSAADLYHAQVSLLMLHQPAAAPRAILHLLRGHVPDYRVLDWLVPLARHNAAEVTLFMGVDDARGANGRKPLVSDLSGILMARDRRQAHIAECRRVLNEAGIDGRLKIRQNSLLTALHDELAEHTYDLVAIAAEAYGDFAQQVGALVRSQASAYLVIKP